MLLVHTTPHLHAVKKVLLDGKDILLASTLGSRAWDALADAVRYGQYSSTDSEVVSFITRAERSSGAHLARKGGRPCQQHA